MNSIKILLTLTMLTTNCVEASTLGEIISESPTRPMEFELINKEEVVIKTNREQFMEDVEQRQKEIQETQEQEVVVEEQVIVEEFVQEVERVQEESYENIQPSNRIYCKFECSFYTTSPDEGSGTGIGASGEYVQPWVSIALPSDVPFYSTAHIEGLGTFTNHDTGSYIQWSYNEYGELLCRVDILVSSKAEAYSLGRFEADGYIDLYE